MIPHQNELHGRGTDLFIITTIILGLTSLGLAIARIIMTPINIVPRNDELHGRDTDLFIITIIFGLLSFVLTIDRIMSRIKSKSLGWDDLAVVLPFKTPKVPNAQHPRDL